ncbi:hypothetical protein MBGDN05_00863 [Thermoplasmatales archaeon SCGC AB-539-N05]|nr:hypothetical protein MBGDN05_00863 [Thermoplasmatales archaeon SCGC AB-539-N05]
MKKTIVMGSLFAVCMLLLVPCIPAAQVHMATTGVQQAVLQRRSLSDSAVLEQLIQKIETRLNELLAKGVTLEYINKMLDYFQEKLEIKYPALFAQITQNIEPTEFAPIRKLINRILGLMYLIMGMPFVYYPLMGVVVAVDSVMLLPMCIIMGWLMGGSGLELYKDFVNEVFDPELPRLMRRAGLYMLIFGEWPDEL